MQVVRNSKGAVVCVAAANYPPQTVKQMQAAGYTVETRKEKRR